MTNLKQVLLSANEKLKALQNISVSFYRLLSDLKPHYFITP